MEGGRRDNVWEAQQDLPAGGGDEKAKLSVEMNDGSVTTVSVPSIRSMEGGRRDKDAKHLISIFPEEVWLLMFDAMDTDNVENVSNSSPFFRELLLSRRVLFLFPKVWGVLGVKYEKELDSTYMDYQLTDADYERVGLRREENESDAETLIATRTSYAPWFRIITKFRLVCQTWSKAVDQFYRRQPRYYNMEEDPEYYQLSQDAKYWDEGRDIGDWTDVQFYQQRPEDFQKFIQHFEKTHGSGVAVGRSPFISGYVSFESSNRDIMPYPRRQFAEPFLEGITSILLNYGQFIRHCVLEIGDCFPRRMDYYLKLREWLQMTPNLKMLDIRYSLVKRDQTSWDILNCPSCSDTDFMHVVIAQEQLDELEREVNLYPLPKIESLECIKATDLPSPMFNQLLRQNCHVSTLEVKEKCPHEDRRNYDIYGVSLPNLRELSVQFKTAQDFARLTSLDAVWPLEKLHLDFKRYVPFLEWPIVFSLLEERWGKSLKHLMIHLPRIMVPVHDKNGIVQEYYKLRLELPNVQRLKVVMTDCASLDFILPMRNSLEFLDVSFDSTDTKYYVRRGLLPADFEKMMIIKDVHHWRMETLESNIWTLFPKLKRIDSDHRDNSQTRRKWRRELEKRNSTSVEGDSETK